MLAFRVAYMTRGPVEDAYSFGQRRRLFFYSWAWFILSLVMLADALVILFHMEGTDADRLTNYLNIIGLVGVMSMTVWLFGLHRAVLVIKRRREAAKGEQNSRRGHSDHPHSGTEGR